jgi:hypothetical protein
LVEDVTVYKLSDALYNTNVTRVFISRQVAAELVRALERQVTTDTERGALDERRRSVKVNIHRSFE